MICAAIWANYKPHEFDELPTSWQARIFAAYMVKMQGDAVVAFHQANDK